MDTRKHVRDAVRLLGGPVAAARKLDERNYQTVQQWVRLGRVPAEKCIEIERLLEGAIRCEQLCPSVDWSYLRGTGAVGAQEAA